MSDLSKLTDRQLQAHISATQKQYNDKIKTKKSGDKILALKYKKRLDELKQEQTHRKKGKKETKPQTVAPPKKQIVVQRKNNKVNSAIKYKCKFKTTDKILVVSVDDLDNVKHMGELITYLKSSNIPVTLFPHAGANKAILKEMKALPNAKQGWYGKFPEKLDANPLPGTDKSVIAWSHGQDSEGRKKNIGKSTIARGTRPNTPRDFGKFDQHDLPSVSLGDKPSANIKSERNKVLTNGGVLSVHLHHAGYDEKRKKKNVGLNELKETVAKFKAKGGKIVHMEQLKGCGK